MSISNDVSLQHAVAALLEHMRDKTIPVGADFTAGYRTDSLGPLLNKLAAALAPTFHPMDDADLEGYAGCEFKDERPLMCERTLEAGVVLHLIVDDVNLQAHLYSADGHYLKAWGISGARRATLAIGEALVAGGKFDDAAFEDFGFECCHDDTQADDICAPSVAGWKS